MAMPGLEFGLKSISIYTRSAATATAEQAG
jgi:hypothetical protein